MLVVQLGGDRNLGDVVGVHERFLAVVGREAQIARHDVGVQEVLAEVLGEPAKAQDGQPEAGSNELLLGGSDASLLGRTCCHDPLDPRSPRRSPPHLRRWSRELDPADCGLDPAHQLGAV